MSVISDGENATRLLNDEFLQRVLKELREDCKARIMQTQSGDQNCAMKSISISKQ